MRVALSERESDAATVVLAAALPPSGDTLAIAYRTNTGALARIDGRIAGAFDREHHEIVVPASSEERILTLEVERAALPTNGLPPGPGFVWNRLVAKSREKPSREILCRPVIAPHCRPEPVEGRRRAALRQAQGDNAGRAQGDNVALWGHSHLDVAWLWTYEQTRRKALRTFANAVALLDEDETFVFAQSQPQLFAFVREGDEELYGRVRDLAKAGRFDPDVAALWVEPDCNVPSGESLLRQMLFAHRYCVAEFGCEPQIAWLPDTFGFARTLPTLLAHAGIPYFATTKLQWNDTTRFAHPQFRWRGPDGAEIVGASMDRMEGGADPRRVAIAKEREEPLIVGYGDGGGGPTAEQVAHAESVGTWERPRAFFERLRARAKALPVHDDELYLQFHRGTYTTHHDVKSHNAALERALAVAEERAAWCVAVRVPHDAFARARSELRAAWEIVLRNQFHDVLPGTSIAEVYEDARAEYARAHELVEHADALMLAMLPRPARAKEPPGPRQPAEHDGAFEFDNGLVRATVLPTGTIVELAAKGGRNLMGQGNVLALYRDRPKKWEAWDIDDGYQRSRRAARPQPSKLASDGALEIPFIAGGSPATMRVALYPNEPFLRVDLAIDWRARRTLLRVENWLSVDAEEATYGAPHGTVARSTHADTPERKAQYEVPGQRFAAVRATGGSALAMLALDTYGWSGRTLSRGGLQLGHSLLRSTCWPDPDADAGEQRFSWAYAPFERWSVAAIERAWLRFAYEPQVRLFEPEDDGVLLVACKPADSGNGVVVRVRECDGASRAVKVHCNGRMREVRCIDGLEREVAGDARIEGESLVFELGAFALRSFEVTF